MPWQYHKHIKIIPAIRLSIGREGIRVDIDHNPDAPRILPDGAAAGDDIFSAEPQKITSYGMQGIKEAMLMSYTQQQELDKDLKAVRRDAKRSRLKLHLSHLLLYGIINRSVSRKIRNDILAQDSATRQIARQIERSPVTLRVEFESAAAREQYQRVLDAFRKLTTSHKIWDVTGVHYQDRVAARSSAGTLVNKREVRFDLQSLQELSFDTDVPHFQNADGADLYLYAGFIVVYASPQTFALIGIHELMLSYGAIRFSETGPVPADSTVIDQTWAKVNKNGTPDRRFKSNYQIPIVRYGELRLKTASGLHEEFECSNYEATEAFGLAFGAYQRYLRMICTGN